jgi:hypothetical protein
MPPVVSVLVTGVLQLRFRPAGQRSWRIGVSAALGRQAAQDRRQWGYQNSIPPQLGVEPRIFAPIGFVGLV